MKVTGGGASYFLGHQMYLIYILKQQEQEIEILNENDSVIKN